MFHLVCDSIKKPPNIGSMIRLACGTRSKLWLTGDSTSHHNKKVKSAAVGYEEIVEIEYADFETLVASFKKNDVQIVATSPRAIKTYDQVDYTKPTAFVFGNEATGLSQNNMSLANHLVRIPLPIEVESLNIATAASILIYEALRQVSFTPVKEDKGYSETKFFHDVRKHYNGTEE